MVVRAILRTRAGPATRGVLEFGNLRLMCGLGRSGWRARKREGDGATPVGRFALCRGIYRGDRRLRPQTRLSLNTMRCHDGWCDAVGDRNYNRPVRLPYGARAEHMWRTDGIYDIVVCLNHNQVPRVQGLGSAIFCISLGPIWRRARAA